MSTCEGREGPGQDRHGLDGISQASLRDPGLTCHSLHSGSRAKLNNVSALKSCQNCKGGSLLSKRSVQWGSEPEADT